MSGHHNLKIYTGSDAHRCRGCNTGELVKSAHVFSKESYICWSKKGGPTSDGCEGFTPVTSAGKSVFKVFKEVFFTPVHRTKRETLYHHTTQLLKDAGMDVRTSCGCYVVYQPVSLCAHSPSACPHGYVIYIEAGTMGKATKLINADRRG